MSARASCAGTAAPSSGEMHHRSVQPAAAADQGRIERWLSEGRQLPGECQSSPVMCAVEPSGIHHNKISHHLYNI